MLTHKTMAIVFANMHDKSIPDLTEVRSMASLPIGARYRMIDFYLSSFVNAGITNVGIVVKSNYHSLMDHLGAGREWDLSRKIEGLSIFPPFSTIEYGELYHGRIGALYEVLSFIRDSKAEYVVMADCNHMANFDVEAFVNEHIESGAQVSMVCSPNLNLGRKVEASSVCVKYDESMRITDILSGARCPDGGADSLNLFIVNKDCLVDMVEDAYSRSINFFEREILTPNVDKIHIHCILHTDFVRRVYDNRSYVDASMALLDPVVRDALFNTTRKIYTKVRDDAPAKYGLDAVVKNSLIADGCVIEGTVENSIVFRGVRVEKGAVVRNCVLMQDTVISSGANVESILTDKNVTIHSGRHLAGHNSYPLYIKKYSIV